MNNQSFSVKKNWSTNPKNIAKSISMNVYLLRPLKIVIKKPRRLLNINNGFRYNELRSIRSTYIILYIGNEINSWQFHEFCPAGNQGNNNPFLNVFSWCVTNETIRRKLYGTPIKWTRKWRWMAFNEANWKAERELLRCPRRRSSIKQYSATMSRGRAPYIPGRCN